jgi:hypothetical protein
VSEPGPCFGSEKGSCVGQKTGEPGEHRMDGDSRQKNLQKLEDQQGAKIRCVSGKNHDQLLANFHRTDKSQKKRDDHQIEITSKFSNVFYQKRQYLVVKNQDSQPGALHTTHIIGFCLPT